jgi:hypothetical protein
LPLARIIARTEEKSNPRLPPKKEKREPPRFPLPERARLDEKGNALEEKVKPEK